MVDGLLFAGFRLRQSDSQLKPPPPSISRLNSPVHQIRAYLARTFTDSLAFHSPFMTVEEVRRFGIAAKIALLPQSNFGT